MTMKKQRCSGLDWSSVLVRSLLIVQYVSHYNLVDSISSSTENQFRLYELRFQNELDSSTTIKFENQHQIFKCQVKLAPVQINNNSITRRTSSLISSYSKLADNLTNNIHSSNNKSSHNSNTLPSHWPSNVTLTIDWLRNGRLLGDWLGESGEKISRISLELGGNNNKQQPLDKMQLDHNVNVNSISTSDGNIESGRKTNSRGRSHVPHKLSSAVTQAAPSSLRVEIKNTSNGPQLKLTSRLRISRLRSNDSGQFKCIAHAEFTQLVNAAKLPDFPQPTIMQPDQLSSSEISAQGEQNPSSIIIPVRFKQILKSHEATLLVTQGHFPGKSKNKKSSKNQILSNSKAAVVNTSDQSKLNKHASLNGGHLEGSLFGEQLGVKLANNPSSPIQPSNSQLKTSNLNNIREQNNNGANPDGKPTLQNNGHNSNPFASLLRLFSSEGEHQNSPNSHQSSATHANNGSTSGDNPPKTSADSSGSWPDSPLQNATDKIKNKKDLMTLTTTMHKSNDETIAEEKNSNDFARDLATPSAADEESGSDGLLVLEAANDLVEQDSLGDVESGLTVKESNLLLNREREKNWRRILWPSSLLVNGHGGNNMTNDGQLDGRIAQAKYYNDNKSSFQVGQNYHDDNLDGDGLASQGPIAAIATAIATPLIDETTNSSQKRTWQHQQQNTLHNNKFNLATDPGLNVNDAQTRSISWFDHSNQFKLVKFFHSQMVEPAESLASCYMNLGEHYAGNVSRSRDDRACLNWLQVGQLLAASNSLNESNDDESSTMLMMQLQSDELISLNHNYCRNYNSNLRGPWCYVQYSEELDDPQANQPKEQQQQRKQQASDYKQTSASVVYLIAKQCNISPCSRYLWLYIVAPPVGLLTLFSIIMILSLKSMRTRRSNYKNYLSSMGKAVLPTRFHKISVVSHGGDGAKHHNVHKIKSANKKTTASYGKKRNHKFENDNHLLEIIDDFEWREECSLKSPLSSDSMKLDYYMPFDSTSKHLIQSNNNFEYKNQQEQFGSTVNNVNRGNYQRSKSQLQLQKRIVKQTNNCAPFGLSKPTPYSTEKLLDISTSSSVATTNTQRTTDFTTSGSECSSTSQTSSPRVCNQQSGPIFATLRCHLRRSLATSSSNCNIKSQITNPNSINHKSSLSASHYATTRRIRNKHHPSDCKTGPSATNIQRENLISCSTTLDDIEPICLDDHLASGELSKAIQLPKIDSTSVTFSSSNGQLLFEGKFSQVSRGNWKQIQPRGTQSCSKSAEDEYSQLVGSTTVNDIGLEIAIHSLKTDYNGGALIDPTIFNPTRLNLRNLNHLNLIKLIGCIVEPEIGKGAGHEYVSCSLVYDMSQLVDFPDWLKQQNSDLVIASQSDLDESSEQSIRLRRNLTCLAKQIALALDYLHDQDIVYQDLACRNCFIDPTKMLVKLATFNQEPHLQTDHRDDLSSPKLTYKNNNDNNTNSNSEDDKIQPLKSMIRPKYLLDYYVIDSRPSGSRLQPLSWIPLESILFNKFNKQTDIWSYGCLLYEIFSLGEVAYFGYSCKQIIDSVRSNLMPPQPSLCPSGIYRLMCNCLSDIPTIRPNIKQIYEQLNLFSGQCSSFLDHHLCSLCTVSSKMEHMKMSCNEDK